MIARSISSLNLRNRLARSREGDRARTSRCCVLSQHQPPAKSLPAREAELESLLADILVVELRAFECTANARPNFGRDLRHQRPLDRRQELERRRRATLF